MKKFFEIIFRHHSHSFSIVNHYHENDIISWNNHIMKITYWNYVYDKKTDVESISYNTVDIYTGKEYADIPENEVSLIAFASEVEESIPPMERECIYSAVKSLDFGGIRLFT